MRAPADAAALRAAMVASQIEPRGISDPRVLKAFREVSRHEFVPGASLGEAYADHPVPIGQGQTISQPFMVALMTQALGLEGDETVLEIGTGSGYQAAILSRLARFVYTVERWPALAERAAAALKRLGCANVEVQVGDGTLGLPAHAPYGGIVVTAGAPLVPPPLVEQLAEGGRLVIPVGNNICQSLLVVRKHQGRIETSDGGSCVFVPLVGRHGWRGEE